MNIYFHCGIPKTGSTSLQNFLNTSSINDFPDLVYYPGGRKAGSSHHLGLAEWLGCHPGGNISHKKLVASSKEIRSIDDSTHSDSKLIVSCEVFFMVGDANNFRHHLLQGLKMLLGDYAKNTRYCFYIRDPIDWCVSMYNQLIRSGRLAKYPSDFSADLVSSLGSWSPDFNSILDNYRFVCSELGGGVDVNVFDRNYLKNGDIINDFLYYLGCDLSSNFINKNNSKSLAPSVDARVIQGILAYSKIINRDLTYKEARHLSAAMSQCIDSRVPTKLLFEEEDLISIFTYFSPIYSTLASKNWINENARSYFSYCASDQYLQEKINLLSKAKSNSFA